jgi:hypothetical protein
LRLFDGRLICDESVGRRTKISSKILGIWERFVLKSMLQKYDIKKRTKDEITKDRLVLARNSSKIVADAIGYKYPMPWTTEEALRNKDEMTDIYGTKLTLASRIHSVADATGTRVVTDCSQLDAVTYTCPFEGCKFHAKICFRVRGFFLIFLLVFVDWLTTQNQSYEGASGAASSLSAASRNLVLSSTTETSSTSLTTSSELDSSTEVAPDTSSWTIRDFKWHTCGVLVCATTVKPEYEDRKDVKDQYRLFSVTPLEKPMLAPALVLSCMINRSLKPKDAKAILVKYVVRDLPRPWVSDTLKIAKEIAKTGIASSEVFLSKLKGHAELLRKLGHHCRVEVTDYQGMVKVIIR